MPKRERRPTLFYQPHRGLAKKPRGVRKRDIYLTESESESEPEQNFEDFAQPNIIRYFAGGG